MKKTLFTFLLFFAATAMNAQTIVMGDMNDDKELTITDAVSVVDVILGKAPKQTISLGGDPYGVDNTLVVGTWYAPDGSSFVFNEDGTTTYPGGATYEFMPMPGRLLIYIAQNRPLKVLPIIKATSEYLLVVDYATGGFTYYTKSSSLASGITLDQTSLTMNSGTTAQLTASITPETAFASIIWTSSDENVATVDANGLVTAVAGGSCTITATTSGSQKTATCTINVTQMVASIVLSQTKVIFFFFFDFVRLTATVLPENAANKNVVWSSSNSDIAPVRSGRVDAYGYGTAVITCEAADGSGVKATCTIYVLDPSTYVDLGLPSGTLWVTCNVGASSPEGYGDYFAWGETSTKTTFNWSNYKWCNGDFNKLTKYCNQSSYGNDGFIDNKTELDPEDDAAYVNWGSAWRMPSREQFEELINSSHTTTEWITTESGVSGRKITSKTNGNSVFLPAAGYRDGSSLNGAGSYGDYWSRALGESHPGNAWFLGFNSSDILTNDNGRNYGKSVRPVRFSE